MRKLVAITIVSALLAACGSEGAVTTTSAGSQAPASTEAPASEPTSVAPTPTSTITLTTAASTTTTPMGQAYTVEDYGHSPTVTLTRSGALGSGCVPNSDNLPDGIWFGWIDNSDTQAIKFDLACLWAGRTQPAASNDASKLRTVAVTEDTVVYNATDQPIPFEVWNGDLRSTDNNAPGLPETIPFWVFVNNGLATEIVEYPVPIYWAFRASAWPEVVPGCCDGGDIAPVSPDDPWPTEGWPADGFYKVWVDGRSRSNIDITMHKWLSCGDFPEMCPEWWTEENVTTGEKPLETMITFDRDLTVVILPISSNVALVGNGIVFRELLDEIDLEIETWIRNPETAVTGEEMAALPADPEFPFGTPNLPPEEQYPIGFRGPGGAHVTYADDPTYLLGWTAMEIRDGKPILYIHAGLIAG